MSELISFIYLTQDALVSMSAFINVTQNVSLCILCTFFNCHSLVHCLAHKCLIIICQTEDNPSFSLLLFVFIHSVPICETCFLLSRTKFLLGITHELSYRLQLKHCIKGVFLGLYIILFPHTECLFCVYIMFCTRWCKKLKLSVF